MHSPMCNFLSFEVLSGCVVAVIKHVHLGLLSKHHSGRRFTAHFSCVFSHYILWLNPNMLLPIVIVHDLYLLCINFVLIQSAGLRLDGGLRRTEDRFNAIASVYSSSLVLGGRWW